MFSLQICKCGCASSQITLSHGECSTTKAINCFLPWKCFETEGSPYLTGFWSAITARLQTRFPPYFLPNPNSHSTLPQAEALWLSLLTGTAVCCLGIQADLLGHPECPSSLPEKLYLTLLMHLACDFVRFKLWCQERNTTVNETEEIVGSHGQIKSYLIQPGRRLPHRLPGRWMLGGIWAHISAEGSHTGRHRHMLAHMLHRDKTQANRQTHTGRQPKDKG